MILCIDIGNTRIKAALFSAGEGEMISVVSSTPNTFFSAIKNALGSTPVKIKYIGWLSVGGSNAEMLKELETLTPGAEWIRIGNELDFPFRNNYASPDSLGMDRLAGLAGARERITKGPLLVISAGTALTYDLLNDTNDYSGGAISPGIRMRFRALNEFTAKLPLVSEIKEVDLIGNTTEKSILSGVLNGIVSEIDGMIGSFREKASPALQVFLTGGDSLFLGNHLKNINFVAENLILNGIKHLVKLNRPNA